MDKWVRKIEYKIYDSSVFLNTGKWDVRKAKVKSGRGGSISDIKYPISDIYSKRCLDQGSSIQSGGCCICKILFEYVSVYAVYDFHFYAKERQFIRKHCQGRTPDYILCYPDGTIGILESKGITAADPTAYLVSAHEQCENGKKFLNDKSIAVRNTYASVVSFAMYSPRMKRKTCLYIADSEDERMFRDDNLEKNSLYEYSKWFYNTIAIENRNKIVFDDGIFILID